MKIPKCEIIKNYLLILVRVKLLFTKNEKLKNADTVMINTPKQSVQNVSKKQLETCSLFSRSPKLTSVGNQFTLIRIPYTLPKRNDSPTLIILSIITICFKKNLFVNFIDLINFIIT